MKPTGRLIERKKERKKEIINLTLRSKESDKDDINWEVVVDGPGYTSPQGHRLYSYVNPNKSSSVNPLRVHI